MSNMTIFGNNKGMQISEDMLNRARAKKIDLGGSGGGIPRISIKGGKFRQIIGGEQVNVSHDPELNVVILDASKTGRIYYEGEYDGESKTPPTCWSPDDVKPDKSVEEPMCATCAECEMNIKGSGKGKSKACRYNKRLAIALEGDMQKVYMLSVPATSMWGDVENNNMPLTAYSNFLDEHGVPVSTIITTLEFDEDSETPKLFFRATRPLNEEEFEAAMELQDSDATKKAVTFTVAKADGIEDKKSEKKAPAKKSKPALKVVEDDEDDEPAPPKKRVAKKKVVEEEDVPEPTKVTKKRAVVEEDDDDDLNDILDEFDDE